MPKCHATPVLVSKHPFRLGGALNAGRLMRLAAVMALSLVACSRSTSPDPSQRSPPTIAGAWVGEVNGIRVRLDLTETPTTLVSGVLVSSFDVSGSGTLTSVSNGESVGVRPSGTNSLQPTEYRLQAVLINFFVQPPLVVGSYGAFDGTLQGGTLVGNIRTTAGIPVGSLFGTAEFVPVVFSRP
jgi:hypothetical protein